MAMKIKNDKDDLERSRPSEKDDQDIERESSIRLGSGKGAKGGKLTFKGFRQIMKVVRGGRRVARGKSSRRDTSLLPPPRPSRAVALRQQVAVRLTYSPNKVPGQWGAHGAYIERESATPENKEGRGFDAQGDTTIRDKLDSWQKANDPRIFKLIISPEHGSQLDLREFTREYMAGLQEKLGRPLEWVAADHYNTDDPHVHVALRGVDALGKELIIPREFVRGELRGVAMDIATKHLGHRTAHDVSQARERQITQHRYTDLDRTLDKIGKPLPGGAKRVDFSKPVAATASENQRELRLQLLRRLAVLEQLGLASRETPGVWQVTGAAQSILRERQKANDRLKTLHAHKAMVSDPRIPLAPFPDGEARVSGRLIGTGLDDATGRTYMLVESTAGSVQYLYQTLAAERARRDGLKPGDFLVVTQRQVADGKGGTKTMQNIRGLGPADDVLKSPKALATEARMHVTRTGAMPTPSTWGGWLGQFHQAVAKEAVELQKKGQIKEQGGRFVAVDLGRRQTGPSRG